MPIYEFACSACANEFEELVSMSAVNGVACPACGSKHTEKLLSSFQRVRVGKADLPATVTSGARAGGCCGGGCGCG
jgi:putative FmdB family regulatory protein